MSSGFSPVSASVPSAVQYKKFSHSQIRDKVSKRGNVPMYFDLLMSCAVKEDESGIVFDSFASGWKKLVEKCDEADKMEKIKAANNAEKRQNKITTGAASPASASASSSSGHSASADSQTNSSPASPSSDDARAAAARSDSAYSAVLLAELGLSDFDAIQLLERSTNSSAIDNSALAAELRVLSAGEKIDLAALKSQCQRAGIPHKFRYRIWLACLNGAGSDSAAGAGSDSDSAALEFPSSLAPSNLRVIRADIDRTLPHLSLFQRSDTKQAMERCLTGYCLFNGIGYKQGMNYILAPFLLLGIAETELIQSIYSKFINKFLRSTFGDADFGGLQCLFQLFKFLIAYHDPELSNFLEKHEIGCELYASSWFITLFVNRCRLDVVIFLWDSLILDCDNERFLHYFLSLALLLSHRAEILRSSVVMLPELLSKLSIGSTSEASVLIQRAKLLYRSQTSAEFMKKLTKIANEIIPLDSAIFHEIFAMPALPIGAAELVDHAYSSGSASLRVFILDCRPLSDFQFGHLPCSFHLDLDNLKENDRLEKSLESLESMKGIHFAVLNEFGLSDEIGDARENKNSNSISRSRWPLGNKFIQLIRLLTARGFKFVSYCEGGFRACHAVIKSRPELELIDHQINKCRECEKNNESFTETGQRWIENVKRAIEGATTLKKASDSESPAKKSTTDSASGIEIFLPSAAAAQRLIIQSIRDSAVGEAKFRSAITNAVQLMFPQFLDEITVLHQPASQSHAPSQLHQNSFPPIRVIGFDQNSFAILTSALKDWSELVHIDYDLVKSVEQRNSVKSILKRPNERHSVILFQPIVDTPSAAELNKFAFEVSSASNSLYLFSIFISRPALSLLSSGAFKLFCAVGIDEIKNNRMTAEGEKIRAFQAANQSNQ